MFRPYAGRDSIFIEKRRKDSWLKARVFLVRFGCFALSAAVAQLVERVLGKDEVMGSSPISSSE
jgi:hypothetical protein